MGANPGTGASTLGELIMTQVQSQAVESVDVVFPIGGQYLARDHAHALRQTLCLQMPWLETQAHVGIHPIKLVPGSDTPALLSRRSLLLLRVPTQRAQELCTLAGLDLMVDGHRLHLGRAHLRGLEPHSTLYAYKVAADSEDEVVFMAAVARELAELGIGGERVCGKRQVLSVRDGVVNTFSLMLHALPPDQSLRLQHQGIGLHRLLGCGIFIPHKSAAAV